MTERDDLVPISSFFFDDAGPHVVRAGFPPNAESGQRTRPARGQELRSLLNTSIAQLGGVSGETRRRTPFPLPAPVAIDTLLYRGRAALERALEIRNDIVTTKTPPAAPAIAELLDLIALAATD